MGIDLYLTWVKTKIDGWMDGWMVTGYLGYVVEMEVLGYYRGVVLSLHTFHVGDSYFSWIRS